MLEITHLKKHLIGAFYLGEIYVIAENLSAIFQLKTSEKVEATTIASSAVVLALAVVIKSVVASFFLLVLAAIMFWLVVAFASFVACILFATIVYFSANKIAIEIFFIILLATCVKAMFAIAIPIIREVALVFPV
jgi:hypothetical protein